MSSKAEARAPVIAIDGSAGAGKTTAGVWLARRLGVRLIESGYFFRGLAAAPAGLEALPGIDIDARIPPDDEWRPSLRVDGRIVDEVRSPAIEERLAALAKDPRVRAAISMRVSELAAQGGGVVLGRRTALESCRGAAVRIFMTATDEVRLRRRLRADGEDASEREYGARMRAREPAADDDHAVYTMRLDTTDMSVGEVREALQGHVGERLAR